jgi:hypothetical protein
MAGETDTKDKTESRKLAIVLISLVLVLVLAVVFLIPSLLDVFATYLSPGLGLKDAAVIAFIVTLVTLVVFAVAAGDGFLGEIQFMLGAFFAFFVIFWLMIAWIF